MRVEAPPTPNQDDEEEEEELDEEPERDTFLGAPSPSGGPVSRMEADRPVSISVGPNRSNTGGLQIRLGGGG